MEKKLNLDDLKVNSFVINPKTTNLKGGGHWGTLNAPICIYPSNTFC